jgi:uncharacterized protein YjbI with pentapeptide repeats
VYRCVPADRDQSNAKLTDTDLPGSDLSGFGLSGAHMEKPLQNAKLHNVCLPRVEERAAGGGEARRGGGVAGVVTICL